MSWAVRCDAQSIRSMSTIRSNRYEASEGSESRREVVRILTGSKNASSRRIVVVASVTSVFNPPMTPARATGRLASAITSISGVNVALGPVDADDLLARRRLSSR